MSGLEVLAIAASVLQIADLGARLSVKLFTVSRSVKGAERAIQSVSQEIAVTSTVLGQLGNELKKDEQGELYSTEAISTTNGIIDGCRGVFEELERALGGKNGSGDEGKDEGGGSTTFADLKKRLRFTFMESQIDGLRSKLERFKSSLLVMLNLLIFAGQIRSHKSIQSLAEQKALLQGLAESTDSAALLRSGSESPVYVSAGQTTSDREVGSQTSLEGTDANTAELKASVSSPREPGSSSIPLEDNLEGPAKRRDLPDDSSILTARAQVRRTTSPPMRVARSTTTRSLADSDIAELKDETERGSCRPPSPRIRKFRGGGYQNIPKPVDERTLSLYRKDLEQHAALVSKLVDEVFSPEHADLDFGIRGRVEKGILKQHHDEWLHWTPLIDIMGLETLLPFLEKYPRLDNYWRRMEFEFDQTEMDFATLENPDVFDTYKFEQVDDADEDDHREVLQPPRPRALEEETVYGSVKGGHSSESIEQNLQGKKEEKAVLAIDLHRPTYIKVNRKYLHPDTLDAYGLPWEWYEDGEYIIITRYLGNDFLEELFEHTRRLRELRGKLEPFTKEAKTITSITTHGHDIEKSDNGNLYVVRRKSKRLDDGDEDSLDDLLKRFTNLSEEERKTLPKSPEEENSRRRKSWMFT